MRHLILLLALTCLAAGEITIPPGATAVGSLIHQVVIPATKADLQTPVLVQLEPVTVVDTSGKSFTLTPACRAQGVIRVDPAAMRAHLEIQRLVWVAPAGQIHEVPVTAYVIDATATPTHGLPGIWKSNLEQVLTLPADTPADVKAAIAKGIEPTLEIAAQRFTVVFLQPPMKLGLGESRPVVATVAAGSYPGAKLIGGIELSDRQMTPVLIEMLLPLTTPDGTVVTQACRITGQATAIDGRMHLQALRLSTLRNGGSLVAGEIYGAFTVPDATIATTTGAAIAAGGVAGAVTGTGTPVPAVPEPHAKRLAEEPTDAAALAYLEANRARQRAAREIAPTMTIPSGTALTLVLDQPASLR